MSLLKLSVEEYKSCFLIKGNCMPEKRTYHHQSSLIGAPAEGKLRSHRWAMVAWPMWRMAEERKSMEFTFQVKKMTPNRSYCLIVCIRWKRGSLSNIYTSPIICPQHGLSLHYKINNHILKKNYLFP